MDSMKNMASAKRSATLVTPAAGAEDEGPEYPYGLCIDLNDEVLAKLGITDLPKTGTEYLLTAQCVVKSVSENQMQGEKPMRSMCLQITDASLGSAGKGKTTVQILYGDD
jgi:hypothetical protein